MSGDRRSRSADPLTSAARDPGRGRSIAEVRTAVIQRRCPSAARVRRVVAKTGSNPALSRNREAPSRGRVGSPHPWRERRSSSEGRFVNTVPTPAPGCPRARPAPRTSSAEEGGRMGRRMATLLFALALTFAVAACNEDHPNAGGESPGYTSVTGDGGTSPAAEPSAFPVTVTGTTGAVTIDAAPRRIVSLSPSATEDLFAVGAGDQVVAVDDQSDYPHGVPTTNLSGYEPNVEAIAGYDPDLVVYATEPGDLGDSLKALGIQALQLDAPTDLDGAFAQLQTLATATGHASEGATFVSDLMSRVSDVTAGVDTTSGLTYYYELDDTYYSVTSDTFIGQLFAKLGMENIADAAKGASSGYPQLSAEYIVEQDPDLIFLADTECCGQSADTVADRSGWTDLSAVTDGNVVELQDDVASRWGPRVVDLLEQISDAATSASGAAAA